MSTNCFSQHRLEFHILQSFPVSCLNRDDMNSPKSAVIGGVSRARVSSQCWKRAVRMQMHELGTPIATRTKLFADILEAECSKYELTPEQTKECLCFAFEAIGMKPEDKKAKNKKGSKNKPDEEEPEEDESSAPDKSDTLLYISESEAKSFVKKYMEPDFDTIRALKGKTRTTALTKLFKKGFDPNLDALDIALFGRMMAKAADLDVEAAASFAHAISIHKVTPELEFFTAVDDLKGEDESGSAHMGTLEYNSATYYRYISLDLGQLAKTLMTTEIEVAVEAFMKALVTAVPSARQTTMAAACPWNYAIVTLRKGQNLQIPFTKSVKPTHDNPDMVSAGIAELKKNFTEAKEFFGEELFGLLPDAEYEVGPGKLSFEALKAAISVQISALRKGV